MANIIFNSSGTDVLASPLVDTINVNGVSQPRLILAFSNATTGVSFALSTANIPAGKIIDVLFLGCVR